MRPEAGLDAPKVGVDAAKVRFDAPKVGFESARFGLKTIEVRAEPVEVSGRAPTVGVAPPVVGKARRTSGTSPGGVGCVRRRPARDGSRGRLRGPEVGFRAPRSRIASRGLVCIATQARSGEVAVSAMRPEVGFQLPEVGFAASVVGFVEGKGRIASPRVWRFRETVFHGRGLHRADGSLRRRDRSSARELATSPGALETQPRDVGGRPSENRHLPVPGWGSADGGSG
jgi:hypothetical protein